MHLEGKKERNIIVVNWCCILVFLGVQWMMPKGINNRLIYWQGQFGRHRAYWNLKGDPSLFFFFFLCVNNTNFLYLMVDTLCVHHREHQVILLFNKASLLIKKMRCIWLERNARSSEGGWKDHFRFVWFLWFDRCL